MYATIASSTIRSESLDEARTLFTTSTIPLIHESHGLRRVISLYNAETHRDVSIFLADMPGPEGELRERWQAEGRKYDMFNAIPSVQESLEVLLDADSKPASAACARVTRTRIDPSTMDQAVEICRSSIVPVAEQQSGFLGLLMLGDRETGKGVTLSFWATEMQMTIGEQSGYYQEQIARIIPLVTEPPSRETLNVVSVIDALSSPVTSDTIPTS